MHYVGHYFFVLNNNEALKITSPSFIHNSFGRYGKVVELMSANN